MLYNLDRDPSENWNVAADHADVLVEFSQAVQSHWPGVLPGEPQIQ
ncbi:MAG: hypothetical protein HZA46_05545 [Planctomycetales bacterium]|nr:hypothetical protein [Planctomycetales bacterium]